MFEDELPFEQLERICEEAELPTGAIYLLDSIGATLLRSGSYSRREVLDYVCKVACLVRGLQEIQCLDPEKTLSMLRSIDEYHAEKRPLILS